VTTNYTSIFVSKFWKKRIREKKTFKEEEDWLCDHEIVFIEI
jgi:hypothetical protein